MNTFTFGVTTVDLAGDDSALVIRGDGAVDLFLPNRRGDEVPIASPPEKVAALAIRMTEPGWMEEQVRYLRKRIDDAGTGGLE